MKTPQEWLERIRDNVIIEDGMELHSMNFYDIFEGFFDEYRDEIEWNNGASRLVIIPKKEDFVLKISFTKIVDESDGVCEEDCYDEEDREDFKERITKHAASYYRDCEGYYYYMEEPGKEDFCREEARIYEKAAKAGLGKVFAAEWYIGNLDRLSVYAQEKAETLNDCDSNSSESSVIPISSDEIESLKLSIEKMDGDIPEDISKRCKWLNEKKEKKEAVYYHYATMWFALVLFTYGYEFFQNLVDFCEKNGIGDLHHGNVGFKDGKPILIDYATFC